MFSEIFLFELKYRLKRPATYVYFFIFFLFPFVAMISDIVQVGGATGKILKNTPFIINTFVIAFSTIGVVIASAVMSVPIYRDIEHQIHTFYYTLPIRKNAYLGGRFLGSFLVLLFIFLSVQLGIFIGTIWPTQEADQILPFRWSAYWQPFVLFMLPNLLFTGAIFFSLVALTRTIMAAYLGSVIFLVAYLLTFSLLSDIENQRMVSLLDPFGNAASDYITRYWTIFEKNNALLPFDELILLNRLIWITVSVVLLAFTFYKFDFSILTGASAKRISRKAEEEKIIDQAKPVSLPQVKTGFSFFSNLKKMFSLAALESRNIVKDVYFVAILGAGILFLGVDAWYSNQLYGTSTYPVTYIMLNIKNANFILFAIVLTVFYAGELVWRERSLGFASFADAFPVPNWLSYGAKLLSLYVICFILCCAIMVVGVLAQTAQGYFKYEFALYFKELFFITFPFYLLFATFSFFVQVLINNKFAGHLVVVLAFIINTIVLPQLDYSHNLYRFASRPGYIYSDMNGYGHFVKPLFWFTLYWAFFAAILVVIGNTLWKRGVDLRPRFGKKAKTAVTIFFLGFCAVGIYIYYNTNLLNAYYSTDQLNALQADYEKQYKKYEPVPQPRITDVKIKADIFPEQRRAVIKGNYILENKTTAEIDSLHVNIGTEAGVKSKLKMGIIHLNNKPGRIVMDDEKLGYHIYKLPQPLLPGQTLTFDFEMEISNKGFRVGGENNTLVANGTFFNSSILPGIGYDPNGELGDNKERKKLKLPDKKRMADVNDSTARMNTYISRDADWVTFEATVSTSPNQIAIAPGYLQREWQENDRRYFHYKMDSKILNFYSFLSADYQVKKDKWKDVTIEIYYQKGHEYNLDRMIKATKLSLNYFTQHFSPYQHRQVRIIEFPRYASFAQSFPNTIPYSESIGFIAKVNSGSEEDIDYPFYVTAHEVAHQWWAHQVIGGNVQGSTVMSETMSQYAALMVMEKAYGRNQMKRFLKYELDNYLQGRSGESEKELPLYRVENQTYIHYQKGSLVMYALRDYIGEENLNKALAAYIKKTAFQEAPYTNSLEFLSFIKQATPDSLQYLVKDMFEEITLYENRITNASYTRAGNRMYKVALQLNAKKFIADSLGYEKEQPFHDWVEIGVFAHSKENSSPLYIGKHRLKAGENNIEILVKEKPERAGIDPYFKLVDRNPEDNIMRVSER
jgi:hypothetical protein